MTISGICIHRPPGDQDPDLAILVSLGATNPATAAIPAENARYGGTYSVVLLASVHGTGDRHVSVVAEQTVGGTIVGSATVERDYDTTSFDGLFLVVGELTLPPYRVPDDCTTSEITFTITGTNTGGTNSQWADLLLLDTYGQAILVGSLPAGTTVVYVDEPDAGTNDPHVYASASDRSAAFSVMGIADVTGGPISFDPGDNRLLVVTPTGLPDLTVDYFPRWLDERTA